MEHTRVVLDLSSNLCKVGFAGEAAPRHIVYRHTLHGARDGSLTHEERVELMLRDILTRLLMCTARRRHILVCESLVEPTRSREALVKVLVQRLGAASVCLLPAPQLALYGSGLDGDGLVVLVGYGETSVLPVSCNVPLVHSAGVAMLGTRDLLLCLHSLSLEGKHVLWGGEIPEVAATRQAAGVAGEAAASITPCAGERERALAATAAALPPGPDDTGGREVWEELLLAICAPPLDQPHVSSEAHSSTSSPAPAAASMSASTSVSEARDAGATRAPVGAASGEEGRAGCSWVTVSLTLGEQRWQARVSREARRQLLGVLFGRSCVSYVSAAGPGGVDSERSVAGIVLETLLKCPVDVRGAVASRVVAAGGGAMLPAFQELLMHECTRLARLVPRYRQLERLVSERLRFVPRPFPAINLPWVGGAIYGAAIARASSSHASALARVAIVEEDVKLSKRLPDPLVPAAPASLSARA